MQYLILVLSWLMVFALLGTQESMNWVVQMLYEVASLGLLATTIADFVDL